MFPPFPKLKVAGSGTITPPTFNPDAAPPTIPPGRWVSYLEGGPELVQKGFETTRIHLEADPCVNKDMTDCMAAVREWLAYGYIQDDGQVWALIVVEYSAIAGTYVLQGFFTLAKDLPLLELYEDFMLAKFPVICYQEKIRSLTFEYVQNPCGDRLWQPFLAAINRWNATVNLQTRPCYFGIDPIGGEIPNMYTLSVAPIGDRMETYTF